MKAVTISKTGGPEVLELKDFDIDFISNSIKYLNGLIRKFDMP